MEVSLILPALNEEKTIGKTISSIKNALSGITTYEIIVVDSDSKDRTAEISRKNGAVVVNEPKLGYSNALRKGFSVAKGKYIMMCDPDGSYDPDTLKDILKYLREGYDYVNTDRFANLKPGSMSFKHRFGNKVINGLGNMFFGAKGKDVLSGYKGFRASSLRRLNLKSEKWDFNIEVHSKIKGHDMKSIEIPTTYHPRKGESKLSGAVATWHNLRYMLLNNPKVIFIYPAIFLILIGISGIIFSFFLDVLAYISLLVFTIFIVFGFQMFFFGISAKNYLVKKGFEKGSHLSELGRYMTFERGLIGGIFLLLISICVFAYIIIKWTNHRSLEITDIRTGILGFGIVSLSASLITFSFINQIMSE